MDYRGRMARAQEAMGAQGLDWLLVAASADLTYLTGLRMQQGDRLTALLLPATGAGTLLVPALEAAALDQSALPAPLLTWPDGTDPLALIVERLSGAPMVGVSESLWARDLLPLLERLAGTRVTTATPVLRPLRLIKDEAEINLLRRAAQAADRVFERITSVGLEGRTEIEVAGRLNDLLVDEGHDAPAFTIVASGPHGASPHHEPGHRSIARGDLVVLDFGGTIDGYYSDITRTLAVGEPGPEVRAAYEAVRAAQEIGVQAVRPGATTGAVDRATRNSLEQAGYGPYFVHRTGHGLGLEVHEPPYLVSGDETVLQPGMVFSVEPGVYLPGRFGVRIEDIVVVTPDGVERLNTADRALRVAG
ncbi:MAG TPA: Xaa-Pro peptidase family protein [Chloroflexota bacterium]|nr:Xaa-Pro peptidase family protein [Chloroflexota bacterium]